MAHESVPELARYHRDRRDAVLLDGLRAAATSLASEPGTLGTVGLAGKLAASFCSIVKVKNTAEREGVGMTIDPHFRMTPTECTDAVTEIHHTALIRSLFGSLFGDSPPPPPSSGKLAKYLPSR